MPLLSAAPGAFPLYCRIECMVDNAGKYPVEVDSNVGFFRVRVGDLIPVVKPIDGAPAEFQKWSDAEIEAFLGAAGGKVTRAIAYSYDALALDITIEGVVVKDFDLQVDPSKRIAHMRELAKEWHQRANAEDESEVSSFEYFVPKPFETYLKPEGAPHRWF